MKEQNREGLVAVVLAAGTGSRLHPLTAERPKTLVEVGPDGETILDLLLRHIAASGIGKCLIVTGYRHDSIERHIENSNVVGDIGLVFNSEFDSMNNARSLLAVREQLEGRDFVKFDGDLVLDPGLLPLLLESGDGSATLVDSARALVDEDMKAMVDPQSGLVTAFGKHLSNDSYGVSIGIERIAAAHSTVVFDGIDRLIYELGRGDGYYEDAYQLVLARGLDMRAVSTRGLPWQEIDDHADLAAARTQLAKTPGN